MEQEMNITLKLTLSTDTNLSKDDIARNIEATFHTLFTRYNNPLSAILSKYEGGELLLDTHIVEVIEVKNEADIYELN